MKPDDELIASADLLYSQGRWKEAHIQYGLAVSVGASPNHHCRQLRGICSRMVAEQRMQLAVDHPEVRQDYLDQAALWLAKSEANLDSAFDEAPDHQLGHIRLEQAKTEDAIVRFMEMSGGNPERRVSAARMFRSESVELLADV